MIKPLVLYCTATLLCLIWTGCDDDLTDKVPSSFLMVQVNADDIYLYNNGGNPYGVRLDPLVNDSIKVDVTVSYSTPTFGTISFIQNEGWFYKPNDGFVGTDNLTYTVCHKEDDVKRARGLHRNQNGDNGERHLDIGQNHVAETAERA